MLIYVLTHDRSVRGAREAGRAGYEIQNCTRLLLNTRPQSSTDPKDKIFAFQGLLSLLGIDLPAPDYSKSVIRVYVEAAAASINHDKSLMMLSALTGESCIRGLPSWVPDWSDNKSISEIASWYDSSSTGHSRFEFKTSPDLLEITLCGKIIDKVSVAALAFPSSRHLLGEDIIVCAREREVKSLREWFSKFGNDKKMLELFCKFPRNAWIGTQDPVYLDSGVVPRYWITLIMDVTRDTLEDPYSKRISHIADEIQFNKTTYRNIRTSITRFHEIIRTFLDRKTMFRTQRGKLGIGCRALQKGDQIALFSGCNLPMVIRKKKLHWRIICPAYIQGVMHSRKAWRSSEFPLEDFVIK
jgi:hypothetical protein